MNVLINASTVKIGGGRSVALNFLNSFKKPESWDNVFLMAPENCGYEKVVNKSIKSIYLTNFRLKILFRPFLERVIIRRFIKNHSIDLIFCLGNLPLPFHCKQAILFDNPFASAKNLEGLNLSSVSYLTHYLRKTVFFSRVKYVDLIFVQTQIIKEKLKEKLKHKIPIEIAPNSFSTLLTDADEFLDLKLDKERINLLAFSWYYEHKNLEILVDLAILVKKLGGKYKIHLTIGKRQGGKSSALLKKITDNSLENYIYNIGSIEPYNLAQFYSSFDGIILPTLLESYSSVYAEAIKFQNLLFTSDLDFAHEVCQEAAVYFNPGSAKNILHTLDFIYKNEKNKENQIRKVKDRALHLATWKHISQLIIDGLKRI